MLINLKSGLGININYLDQSDIFLEKLTKVVDPEKKEKLLVNSLLGHLSLKYLNIKKWNI